MLLAMWSGLVVVASAQDSTPPPAPAADPGVLVESFEFHYGLAHPELPAVEELNRVSVRLDRGDGVWRPAANETSGEILTLGSLPAGSRFDGAALKIVAQELVKWYNARDLYGVWVAFKDMESAVAGVTDRRAPGEHTARLVIWASQVAEIRTLARGQRFKIQFSVNNRKHRGIIANSPLKPGATPDAPGSLFRQKLLNNYLYGLSLHPGRLVEASIASAGDPGKVVLDYLVNESKTWQIFSQVTNFGTEATGVWRGRVGFQHNQLTNHDDILNVDAISTPDGKTYGTFFSYRIPLFRPARLLVRIYGSYGDFLAGDAALQNLRFAGKNWLGGIEFTNRLTLPRNWSLVTALGANYPHYEIQSRINETPLVSGSTNFLIPFLSSTLASEGRGWSLAATLRFDHTVGSFANLDPSAGIAALGRISPDPEWTSLRWTVNASYYLERLFKGGAETPYLANEVSLRVRGRTLLRGSRLIPHEQEPIGGAFSVRGYTESVLSADEFVTASVEYAFHLPRVFRPGDPGRLFRRDFKWRPGKALQEPDWDLIGRAFYDYAYRQVTPAPSTTALPAGTERALVDKTLTLAGAGGGLELKVKQNFSLRCDVGLSLTELRDSSRPAGEEVVYPAGELRYYLSSSFSW